MISEMENIQKGIVVSTVEDSANKRVIGIGSSTVTPDPVTGIAPLSKQNAFIKEQAESVQQAAEKVLGFEPGVTAVPAIEPAPVPAEPQPEVVPPVAPIAEPIQAATNPLPEPKVNDLITDTPMKVEIPSELGSIPSSEPLIEPIKEVIAPITEPIATMANQEGIQPQVPAFEPVSEPQPTGEVLATEPTEINEGMFAPKAETPEVPSELPSQAAPVPEMVQPLPFESQPVQTEEKQVQTVPEVFKTEKSEPSLNQEQMEQIAKKISDLVYREVLELLNGITKEQTQSVEEKVDSAENLVNPVLQEPIGYEEKPMAMTL